MATKSDESVLLAQVRDHLGAASARKGKRIQSLWQGYGEVLRVHLQGAAVDTVVLKHVRPPPKAHPRKLRSYQVEQHWYAEFARRCGPGCRVPAFLGGWQHQGTTVFVLEDLDAAGFAGRPRMLAGAQVDAVLSWLAHFHATFMGVSPQGLWAVGTYGHLGTRPDEWAAMGNQALKAKAPDLDASLSGARFQTLVHGDAKTANFCFADSGPGVAAVDFQYVGGGCGIRDVAYFLEGFRWGRGRADRLDRYFGHLRHALGPAHQAQAAAIEAEWRSLYPVAVQDFERFLDGWR